ncbi:Serine-threonine protein kinase [Entamoeba marina]
MLLFLVLLCVTFAYEVIGPGCSNLNEEDNTCLECSSNYESNDLTCKTCISLDPYQEPSSSNPIIAKNNSEDCIDYTHLYQPEDVTNFTLNLNEPFYFNGAVQYMYSRPCHKKQVTRSPYVFGFWMNIPVFDESDETMYSFEVTLSWITTFSVNIVSLEDGEIVDECYGSYYTTRSATVAQWLGYKNKEYQVFVSTEEQQLESDIGVAILAINTPSISPVTSFESRSVEIMNQTEGFLYLSVPMRVAGTYTYPVCAPTRYMKAIRLQVNLLKGVSFLVRGVGQRYRYFQRILFDENGNESCYAFYTGSVEGSLEKQGLRQGLSLLVTFDESLGSDGTYNEIEYQSITVDYLTTEWEEDDYLLVSIICPNNCNFDQGSGICSHKNGGCICNDGKYGRSCYNICYNSTTDKFDSYYGDSNSLCYYGSDYCDEDCECTDGYTVVNHQCVKISCINNIEDSSLECMQGTIHCDDMCFCSDGFKPLDDDDPTLGCIISTCGNGELNDGEECDGGTSCYENCTCVAGLEPDGGYGCKSKSPIPVYGIVLIAVFGVIFIIVFFVVVALLVQFLIPKKRIDLSVYREQQPVYYYDITRSNALQVEPNSSLVDPSPINGKFRLTVDHSNLNFGNDDGLCEINETRFEQFYISNNSNKYMLVIFHTPNNPKFVFHFTPQVYIMKGKTRKDVTSYITLNCTTKVFGMKIQMTFYFSKSKDTLNDIAELLKDKTFENWDDDSRERMNNLMRNVKYKYHGALTIQTDAVNSVSLDLG